MKVITLDFETYFDDDYTLSKLATEEYVRDKRFEAHGAAVYCAGAIEISGWYTPAELAAALIDWSRPDHEPVAMIAHHAHFDGLILSHHFGYRPDFWIDTLSMGRVVFDGTVSLSLESLASRFGLSPKTVPYNAMRGLHWDNMSPELRRQVADGGAQDCALTDHIARCMMGEIKHPAVKYPFPSSELPVVDLTIRMFTEPVLLGDLDALGNAWLAEEQAKQELFSRLSQAIGRDITPEMLRKDALFAELLDMLDVEPELKITNKGNEKYAFAKSDRFMQELIGSEDEDVALLAESRLRAQSSIYTSRVERYGNMAMRGPLCVYLAYAAAHTRRWGGGDKTNFQNLPRADPTRPNKGALRRGIKAP